jgi:glucan biosynthesis protein C
VAVDTDLLPEVARRSRVAWVDRIRIALTALVVAHHAADTYAAVSGWYLPESGTDPSALGLTVFMVVNQTWFMGLFFLLSGLFVPGSAERKGLGRFTRDRLLRLGVPIVGFVVIVRPLCLIPAALLLDERASAAGEPFSVAGFLAFGGDPGVTWFLEVLLVCTLGYVLVRLVVRRPMRVEPRAPRFGLVVAFVVVLAALTWVWQWVTPPGAYWPVVGLPSPSFLPQYVLFFAAGVAAARRGWLDRLPGRAAIPAALALLVGTALYAPTVGTPVDLDHLSAGAASALGQALFAVGAAVLVVVVFRTLLARPAGRVTRFLADQSFVVYLVHPAVLVGVAVLLGPVEAPSAVKAALLFAVGALLSWGAGWLLRRIRPVAALT